MTFYITALPAEAGPFIEKLCMKRLPDENRYRIYAGDGCYLIITGAGGMNAMAAATYLLTRFNAQKTDLVINAGICAAYTEGNEEAGLKGKIFVARSICNSAFGKTAYPDMIYKSPFDEADVMTIPDVYRANHGSHTKQEFQAGNAFAAKKRETPLLVEMEAAFIYESAIRFIYSHNIITIKIVSDFGETGKITKNMVSGLMGANIADISDFAQKIADFNESGTGKKADAVIPEYDQALIDKIVKELRLTEYQQNEIRKLARFYILRGKPLRRILEEVQDATGTETKKEGKAVYGKLRGQLAAP
ncbi:MAG: hypothetical protein ACYCYI_01165 [Saccharofermentanales bacterium]